MDRKLKVDASNTSMRKASYYYTKKRKTYEYLDDNMHIFIVSMD